jgi:hypothetical protein
LDSPAFASFYKVHATDRVGRLLADAISWNNIKVSCEVVSADVI